MIEIHLCGPLYFYGPFTFMGASSPSWAPLLLWALHLNGVPFTYMGPFRLRVALLHLCRVFHYHITFHSHEASPIGGFRGWSPLALKGDSQLVTRSTRHSPKSYDELTGGLNALL